MERKLKINHFKELYKSLKTPFPPINFLILGMLMGLEQRWIDLKAKQTVDNAIEDYKSKMVDYDENIYKAVVEETEDGGFTIGYYPEENDKS
tara:strand:+ start:196 stop:471 length:276 start_codon:yes stop_codon:yes gene_type:complete